MRKINYYIVALLLVMIIPSVVFASWWNPFSWNWENILKVFFKSQTSIVSPGVNTGNQNVPVPGNTPAGADASDNTDIADTDISDNSNASDNNFSSFKITYPAGGEEFVYNEEPVFTWQSPVKAAPDDCTFDWTAPPGWNDYHNTADGYNEYSIGFYLVKGSTVLGSINDIRVDINCPHQFRWRPSAFPGLEPGDDYKIRAELHKNPHKYKNGESKAVVASSESGFFSVLGFLKVDSVTPASASIGQKIEISGKGFYNPPIWSILGERMQCEDLNNRTFVLITKENPHWQGILWQGRSNDDTKISFDLPAKVCAMNNPYNKCSPCTEWKDVPPGKYTMTLNLLGNAGNDTHPGPSYYKANIPPKPLSFEIK